MAKALLGLGMAHAKHEIVLVEDDSGVRQALVRILHNAGYRVRAFESAEALLDLLAAGALPDSSTCVVCDVRLPGVTGIELHRRLSELGSTPHWVFITAHDNPAVRRQAERVAADYLLKPFEGRTLLAVVARLMATE